ncbi:MAG: putative rane protein [Verrucomicrobiota bacterium]|jgi:putative membrane protein
MINGFSLSLRFQVLFLVIVSLCSAGLAMAQAGRSSGAMPNPAMQTGAPYSDFGATANSRTTNAGAKSAGGTLSAMDKNFMINAAKGGMMEVDGGKMAAQKAQDAEVKKFGNRMVNDHSKANDELRAIATRKGMGLPNTQPGMSWKSDKKYMDVMVKDHVADLAEFRQEAKSGSDPDVKRFADKTSTVIEKHLALAKEIDGKLK